VTITNFLFGTALTVSISVVHVVLVSALWVALPLQSRRHAALQSRPPPNRPAAIQK
jgi:hypothetical protein